MKEELIRMLTTRTPLIPLPRKCPDWCDACDLKGHSPNLHFGKPAEIILSMGAAADHGDRLAASLLGSDGEAPCIGLGAGNSIADLTIEEAEQFAGILNSLVARARAGESA